MDILGFVISQKSIYTLLTPGKIYPYYQIIRKNTNGKNYEINIKDDNGDFGYWKMFLEYKPQNTHHFDFYHYPEFPENVSEWTENDWFQYHLKYGG